MGKKKETIKIAVVKWLDACHHHDDVNIEMINGGIVLLSAGILLRDLPDYVAIALDYSQQGDYRDVAVIPRPYIKNIKIVEVPIGEFISTV